MAGEPIEGFRCWGANLGVPASIFLAAHGRADFKAVKLRKLWKVSELARPCRRCRKFWA
jgi:hypothetical protein